MGKFKDLFNQRTNDVGGGPLAPFTSLHLAERWLEILREGDVPALAAALEQLLKLKVSRGPG